MVDIKDLEKKLLESGNEEVTMKTMDKINYKVKGEKKPIQTKDVLQVSITGVKYDKEVMQKYFVDNGFELGD
jgi:hypothetical protein